MTKPQWPHCAECRDAARAYPPYGGLVYNAHTGAYEQYE